MQFYSTSIYSKRDRSIFIIPLIELANIILGSSGGAQLFYGLALILVVLIEPRGIASLFSGNSKLQVYFQRIKNKVFREESGKL